MDLDVTITGPTVMFERRLEVQRKALATIRGRFMPGCVCDSNLQVRHV